MVKKTSLFVLALIISLSTYKLCYLVAEKYFFDKFFYYKNINYGYWIPNKNLSLSSFGDRAKDLITLQSNKSQILGATDDGTYKIAILGDSLVWGQGVKNKERFAYLLEKELNKIKPTKIISLGNCGDNVFDHYMKYQQSLAIFGKMDLYIFALYNNDFLFNNDDRYLTPQLINTLAQDCRGQTFTNPSNFDVNNRNSNLFANAIEASLNTNSLNLCAYKHLTTLLPRNNAIYIDLGSLEEDWSVQKTFSRIVSGDLNAIVLPFQGNIKTQVSQLESHPSVYSHQTYAEVLYQEITTNPVWNFRQ